MTPNPNVKFLCKCCERVVPLIVSEARVCARCDRVSDWPAMHDYLASLKVAK